ncbi:hypothetical protein [Nonomuraea candida]|uniref:hypothetical protein n=1 Tax=Nonomuraea candida TaxID=359159 RepID=UPI0012F9EE2B|nr:hypothetical protein [Nonomuraea candida]
MGIVFPPKGSVAPFSAFPDCQETNLGRLLKAHPWNVISGPVDGQTDTTPFCSALTILLLALKIYPMK